MKEKRILAICGMHRSGTSLITSSLNASGMFIGEKLIGPTYGNPRGHFEDYDFVDWQETVLKANNIALHLSAPDKEIKITNAMRHQAWKLLSSRASLGQWGWKDPRTSLLLDFWKSEIPGLKVCIIYRDYQSVVDSLLRRARRQSAEGAKRWMVQMWHSPSNFMLRNRHLSTWIAYNSRLLEFAKANPADTCVINLADWVADRSLLGDFLQEAWGFRLNEPTEDFFDASQLKPAKAVDKISFRKSLATTADELMQAFEQLALKKQRIYQ